MQVAKQQPLTLKGARAKQLIDRVGGVGSILTGFGCGAIGYMDYGYHRTIWQVWAIMTLILIGNGIAMLIHAQRASYLKG